MKKFFAAICVVGLMTLNASAQESAVADTDSVLTATVQEGAATPTPDVNAAQGTVVQGAPVADCPTCNQGAPVFQSAPTAGAPVYQGAPVVAAPYAASGCTSCGQAAPIFAAPATYTAAPVADCGCGQAAPVYAPAANCGCGAPVADCGCAAPVADCCDPCCDSRPKLVDRFRNRTSLRCRIQARRADDCCCY